MKTHYTYNKSTYEILTKNDPLEVRDLFAIFDTTPVEDVYALCYLWTHWYFPEFFERQEAGVHIQIMKDNCDLELGLIKSLTVAGYRGLAKTTLSKLIQAFFLANNYRSDRGLYYKIISKTDENAVQIVTDLYNMLTSPRVYHAYAHIWKKPVKRLKKKETQHEFDLVGMKTKVKASTAKKGQRGAVQMQSRPDRIWFEDIEDKLSVMSMAETKKIKNVMEEAYLSLAKNGRALYNVNYISIRGNVHELIMRAMRTPDLHRHRIIPIYDPVTMKITWDNTWEEIEQMKKDVVNFQGEMMCNPEDSTDNYFSKTHLDMNPVREPILSMGNWVFYAKRNPSHVYVIGADPAGGNGGDYACAVVIDLTVGEVVAHFYSQFANEMVFGNEICEKGELYGNALIVIEKNNHGGAVILQCIHNNYPNLYEEKIKTDTFSDEYTKRIGFLTTGKSKPIILSSLYSAINNFVLRIPSAIIKKELELYPREYVDKIAVDSEFGHFDGVMALALAWEGRNQAGMYQEDRKDPLEVS